MSKRSESFFAGLLPAIAVVWVIADATVGAASTEATVQSASQPVLRANISSGPTACPTAGPGGANGEALAAQHRALRGLCSAGLRFSAVLP